MDQSWGDQIEDMIGAAEQDWHDLVAPMFHGRAPYDTERTGEQLLRAVRHHPAIGRVVDHCIMAGDKGRQAAINAVTYFNYAYGGIPSDVWTYYMRTVDDQWEQKEVDWDVDVDEFLDGLRGGDR